MENKNIHYDKLKKLWKTKIFIMRSYKINGKQKYSLWEAIKLMENKNIHYEKLYNININWKYLVVKLVDSTL